MTVKTSEKFNNDVKYYYNGTNEKFHFTPSGVALEYTDTEHRVKSDEEKEARKARKAQGFKTREEFDAFEKEGQRRIVKHDILEMN